MSCLYALEINPLFIASFAIIFSHSEGCLFILFIVSFAVQKLLSLIRSHLFSFVFITQKRSCCDLCRCSADVFLFGLAPSSLIHFEFIFVYIIVKCSNFILLHIAVQFSQHHLLKRLSFLYCMFFLPLLLIN